MAKKNGTSEKAAKTQTARVQIDEDDDDEAEAQLTPKVAPADNEDEGDAGGAEETSAPPAPKLAEVIEATSASAPAPRVREAGMVTIACYVDVDPAPVVGHPSQGGYSFIDHGIMKLEARHNYTVPLRVAQHLVDKKIASIVG